MDPTQTMTSEPESTAQKRPFDTMNEEDNDTGGGPSNLIEQASEVPLDPTLEAPENDIDNIDNIGNIDNADNNENNDTTINDNDNTDITPVTPVTPSSDIKPKKKKSQSQQRRLEPFREGKQASVAQIRDLRLLTRFVKDFELKIKQHEIDDYLGFSSRTSRRLRNGGPTKSELVAEGKLERHPRADNWKNGKEKKRKAAMEAGGELPQGEQENDVSMNVDMEMEDNDAPTVDPQLENPVPMDGPEYGNGGYRDSYDLMSSAGATVNVPGMS